MKTIGIVAHSAEGGGLCFLSACREGAIELGAHMHPPIALSAIAMGLSMPGWYAGKLDEVGAHLKRGVEMVAASGADFFVCPDNTAHIALEPMIEQLPLPGLHIAAVICNEAMRRGYRSLGLLGTTWTMQGTVYPQALSKRGIACLVPPASDQDELNRMIFEELCNGNFEHRVAGPFLAAIENLKRRGAEAVILGCTEIPLVVNDVNSSLPVLDSTRLLARHAVHLALKDEVLPKAGWIESVAASNA